MSLKGTILPKVQDLMCLMKTQNDIEQLTSLLLIFSHIASDEEMQIVGFREKQNRNALKMQELYRFMVNHYQDKISLEDVAKNVGMNVTSFCTFFKKRERNVVFYST